MSYLFNNKILGVLLLNALMVSSAAATVVFDGFFDYEFDSSSYHNPYAPADTGGTLSVGFSFEFEHDLHEGIGITSPGFVGGTITSVSSSKFGDFTHYPQYGAPVLSYLDAAVGTEASSGYFFRPTNWSFYASYMIEDSDRFVALGDVNDRFSDLSGADYTIPYPFGSYSPIGYRYGFKEVRITSVTEQHTHTPSPGSTPLIPLLPDVDSLLCANRPNCNAIPLAFDPSGLGGVSPVFIDPVVATGYEYEIAGASDVAFSTLLIPEQGGLANGDLLELLVGSTSYDFVVGATFDFFDDAGLTDLTNFIIQGIDPALGLDPNDPQAFVTGLTFEGFGGQPLAQSVQTNVLMTALTTDTGSSSNNTANVPEPGTILLIGLGLAGLRSSRSMGKRGWGKGVSTL